MLCAHSKTVNPNLLSSQNSSQQYHNNTKKNTNKMHYGNRLLTTQTSNYVKNHSVKVDL